MASRLLDFIGVDVDAATDNINRYIAHIRQSVSAEADAELTYVSKRLGFLLVAAGLGIALLVALVATLVTWLTPALGIAGAWGVAAITLVVLDVIAVAAALSVRKAPVVVPTQPPMAVVMKGMNFRPITALAMPLAVPAIGAALAAASAFIDRRRKPATVSEALAPAAERLSDAVSEGIWQARASAGQVKTSVHDASRPAVLGAMGVATVIGWILARNTIVRRH